jgi:hypothetical protein
MASTDEKEETQERILRQRSTFKTRNSEGISIAVGIRASPANAFGTRAEMLEDNDDLIDRQLGSQAKIISSPDRSKAENSRISAVDSARALA